MNDLKKYISVRSIVATASTVLFVISMLMSVAVGNGILSFLLYIIGIASAVALLINFTVMEDKNIYIASVALQCMVSLIGIISQMRSLMYYGGYMRISSVVAILFLFIRLALLAIMAVDTLTDGKLAAFPLKKIASAALLGLGIISFFSTFLSLGVYHGIMRYWFLIFFEAAAWVLYTAALCADAYEKEISGIISSANIGTGFGGAPNDSYSAASEKLRELKKALDSGILTEEEYNAKRDEIINNM